MIETLAGREEGFTDGRQLIPGRPVNPVLEHLRRQAAAYLERPKGSWEKFL
jgi:hypothetical protein